MTTADDTVGQLLRSAAAEIIQQRIKGENASITQLLVAYATRLRSHLVANLDASKVEAAWEEVPTVLRADAKGAPPAVARLKRAFARFAAKTEADAARARAAAAKSALEKVRGEEVRFKPKI